MKKISIRNLIIVLLCICIVFMALGFTILSMKLKQYKNANVTYDVSITGLQEERILKGGNTKPSYTYKIKNDGLTILTDNKLYNPNDEISYYIIIKNNGTIETEIINLSYSQDILNSNKTNPIVNIYHFL